MAARNLTEKFVKLRNGAKANRGFAKSDDDFDGLGLINADKNRHSKQFQGNVLPPRWIDDIEKLENNITTIESKIRELSSLHTKRLMVTFDTDEEEKEREINKKTAEITTIFSTADNILKQFAAAEATDSSSTQEELKIKKNIRSSMAKKIQTLSFTFRASQKEYMSKLKSQKAEGSGGDIFKIAEQPQQTEVFVDGGFNSMQAQMVDDMVQDVNERDQEIKNIAKSIEELAAIFKELAVLVIDQGTILDRIDYNMETAVEHVEQGNVQLKKAEEHQKNSPALKCIILLVVLIIIMIIVIIAKNAPSK